VLQAVGADELLQVISLLTTYYRKQQNAEAAVSCKRVDILKLTLAEYQARVEQATTGFLRAGKLLFQQKLFASRDLPYTTQLVPLAAILAILGERAENDSIRNKIIRWYWCGVFGELYGGAIETRFARDVTELLAWLENAAEPSTVVDCNFAAARLGTLRTRNSAAYKGLYALLMRDGGIDFRTGEPIEVQSYFEDAIDIHHIFPRNWCIKQGIEAKQYDSIINKTPLSYRTNRIIGGNAPSVYLRRLRENLGIDESRQDQILASHVIDAASLKADDFSRFCELRREALVSRIQNATGKAVAREALEGPDDADEVDEESQEQVA
jgi:hypothetical protein